MTNRCSGVMKITHFNLKRDNSGKLLNVVVPTKSIESNLFKNLMGSIEKNSKFLNTGIIVSAVESTGPEFCYSRSVNKGVESQNADFYLNINDDIVLADGALKQALENMNSIKGIGLHGAVLRYPNGLIQHAGIGFIAFDSLTPATFEWFISLAILRRAPILAIKSIVAYNEKRWPPAYMYARISARHKGIVTGAFHLFDADTYRKAGGYDEEYKMGTEDLDFCLSVIKCGKKVRLDKCVCGIHFEGASGINHGKFFGKASRDRFYSKWDCDTILNLVDSNGYLFGGVE